MVAAMDVSPLCVVRSLSVRQHWHASLALYTVMQEECNEKMAKKKKNQMIAHQPRPSFQKKMAKANDIINRYRNTLHILTK
jgi:hypothetical protein